MVTVRRKTKLANGVSLRWIEEVALPFAGDECLAWPFHKNHLGRGVLKIDYRSVYAQRVICERAHGPPPTAAHIVAHSCGLGHEGCVNHRHLRWATRKENSEDTVAHGRSTRGEANSQCKLPESAAREIKRLLAEGVGRRELAERFGVTKDAIHRIAQGRNWAWL